jgi:hypothetical protein
LGNPFPLHTTPHHPNYNHQHELLFLLLLLPFPSFAIPKNAHLLSHTLHIPTPGTPTMSTPTAMTKEESRLNHDEIIGRKDRYFETAGLPAIWALQVQVHVLETGVSQ